MIDIIYDIIKKWNESELQEIETYEYRSLLFDLKPFHDFFLIIYTTFFLQAKNY